MTRKEVKELREAELKEFRQKERKRRLPIELIKLGIIAGLFTYGAVMTHLYDQLRKDVVENNNIPYKVRQQYMTLDEQNLVDKFRNK